MAAESDQLLETIKTPDRLAQYDPLHAIHLTTQNMVSVFAEQISILPELKSYHKKMTAVEDRFIPGFPPISPITASFFTMWAFHDFRFEKDQESIASIMWDLSKIIRIPQDWLPVIEIHMKSRMGIYEHGGFDRTRIVLKELITGHEWACICPAGYRGAKGELWFVRILGSPFHLLDYGVVFTTPYLLRGHSREEWLEFYRRNGIVESDPQVEKKLHAFMKWGNSTLYWLDFIGNAYAGYRQEVIFLQGIPDRPDTLPHWV